MAAVMKRQSHFCPSDRELALRGQIKTGWSTLSAHVSVPGLKPDELTKIEAVMAKAKAMERAEEMRIGVQILKYQQLCKNARGDGSTSCILCGTSFAGQRSRKPTALHLCRGCGQAFCTRCKAEYKCQSGEILILCKLCFEERELWKKSGAWLPQALPVISIPKEELERAQQEQAAPYKVLTGRSPSGGFVPPQQLADDECEDDTDSLSGSSYNMSFKGSSGNISRSASPEVAFMRSASHEAELTRSFTPDADDKPNALGFTGSLPRSLSPSSLALKQASSVDDIGRPRADTDPTLPAQRLVRRSAMSGTNKKLYESYRQKLRQRPSRSPSFENKSHSLPDSPSSSPAHSPPRSLTASTGHSSRESSPPRHVATTSGEDSLPPLTATKHPPQPTIVLRRPTPPVLPYLGPKPVAATSPLARQGKIDADAVSPVVEHDNKGGGKIDFSTSAGPKRAVYVQEAQTSQPVAGRVSPQQKIEGDEGNESRGEHREQLDAYEEPAAGESPKLTHHTLDRPKRKNRAPSREKLREKALQSPDDPTAGVEESTAQQKKRKPVPMPRRKQPSPAREPVHPSLLQAEEALQQELAKKLGAGNKADSGPQPEVFDEFKKVRVQSPRKTIDSVDEFKFVQTTVRAAEPTEKTSPYDVADEFRRVTPGKLRTEEPDHDMKSSSHEPPPDGQPTKREEIQSEKQSSLETRDSTGASLQSQVPQQEYRWKRKNATRISRAKQSGRPSAHVPADDDFEKVNIRQEYGTAPDAVGKGTRRVQ